MSYMTRAFLYYSYVRGGGFKVRISMVVRPATLPLTPFSAYGGEYPQPTQR